jgi:hypothetical protein
MERAEEYGAPRKPTIAAQDLDDPSGAPAW